MVGKQNVLKSTAFGLTLEQKKLAAVFIDFENFYYSLTNTYNKTYPEADEASVSMIANALDDLKDKVGEFVIRQAFADWSRLQGPKKELQRMGIRIVDVLATQYKNSSDIELSLAAQEVGLTRRDVDTIVIFAGDRDYMLIANRIREMGKDLYILGMKSTLSGDLKKLVGEGNYSYLDLENYFLATDEAELEVQGVRTAVKGIALSADQIKTAEAAILEFDRNKERYGSVKLKEFIVNRLAEVLPDLEHLQRKDVFKSLVDLGILRTESRSPSVDYVDSYPFTVFIVEESNAVVKQIRKNLKEGEELLQKVLKEIPNHDEGVLGSLIGITFRKIDPSFRPEKYGCLNLSEFINRYPGVLTASDRRQGEDIIYEVVAHSK
jgi:uncharacterized LabA/DUF88 family protein